MATASVPSVAIQLARHHPSAHCFFSLSTTCVLYYVIYGCASVLYKNNLHPVDDQQPQGASVQNGP